MIFIYDYWVESIYIFSNTCHPNARSSFSAFTFLTNAMLGCIGFLLAFHPLFFLLIWRVFLITSIILRVPYFFEKLIIPPTHVHTMVIYSTKTIMIEILALVCFMSSSFTKKENTRRLSLSIHLFVSLYLNECSLFELHVPLVEINSRF
jgi:hypothetical protein